MATTLPLQSGNLNTIFDSDSLRLDYEGKVSSYAPKKKPKDTRLGQIWGATRVFFLTSDYLRKLDPTKPDKVNALFAASDSVSSVKVLKTSQYFRDSGAPDRINRIRSDYESVRLTYPRKAEMRHCVLLDRDGTVFDDLPLGRKTFQKSEFFEPTVRFIRQSNNQGVPVIMVTNQPTIAKGFIDFGEVFIRPQPASE